MEPRKESGGHLKPAVPFCHLIRQCRSARRSGWDQFASTAAGLANA